MAKGIRKSSAIITVAAAATPENLFLVSPSGNNARTVILRKVSVYNPGAGAIVRIGTGLAPLVPIIPFFPVLAGLTTILEEEEIPEVEVAVNLTVQSSVLGVQVQVEVEERSK